MITQRADLTFKHNKTQGRHGWLRLTPAYSVKVVQEVLERAGEPQHVLDPFSGTGTTGLVCAEHRIDCDLIEINPFLGWFARVKTSNYTESDLAMAQEFARDTGARARSMVEHSGLWTPTISFIERWWSPERLHALASLFDGLRQIKEGGENPALQLNLVAFCRVALAWSNAAFNHQSMSFKTHQPMLFASQEHDLIIDSFLNCVLRIVEVARQPLSGNVQVYIGDSRRVHALVEGLYDCVITSPPYPNRISYIREVRPYMYWLGYLNEAREAGDLDWNAIGGTWGIATSRLLQWKPGDNSIRYNGFDEVIQEIAKRSPLLANYVHKYFLDMEAHLSSLRQVLAPGAKVFYIIGNSKFYESVVPVEDIYVSLMRQLEFKNIKLEVLRKRNSKKELYEFIVSAERG